VSYAVGPKRIQHFCDRTTAVALPNLLSSITVGYEAFLRELMSEVLIRPRAKRKGSGRIPADGAVLRYRSIPLSIEVGRIDEDDMDCFSPSRYERGKEFLVMVGFFPSYCCLAVTTHDWAFLLLHHKEV